MFVCRVLNHMDRYSYRTCTPGCDSKSMQPRPLLDLTSGYVTRAAARLPKQGAKKPWVIRQNYILDMLMMKVGRMEDGVLRWESARPLIEKAVREDVAVAASAND